MMIWTILFVLLMIPIIIHIIQKKNMEYYEVNGRDAEEIEVWLNSRKWRNEFIYNIRREVLNEHEIGDESEYDDVSKEIQDRVKETMSGKNDTLTIASAFRWVDAPEGVEYWCKREHEFLAWYFGQYIDLHLFK